MNQLLTVLLGQNKPALAVVHCTTNPYCQASLSNTDVTEPILNLHCHEPLPTTLLAICNLPFFAACKEPFSTSDFIHSNIGCHFLSTCVLVLNICTVRSSGFVTTHHDPYQPLLLASVHHLSNSNPKHYWYQYSPLYKLNMLLIIIHRHHG